MPMQLPLRKIFQKRAPGAPRFAISLSGTMIAALSLVLAACVAWAFFMGFMVGKGHNPEAQIQSMTGIALTKDGENEPGAKEPPAIAEQNVDIEDDKSAAAEQPYPFTKPEGESTAAWGENKSQLAAETGAKKNIPAKAVSPANKEKPKQERPKPDNGQIYNYTYQVAAYKSAADANKLCAKLEKSGQKAVVQKSGKVQLVVIRLRGTETDATKLRSKLESLKLGKPLMLSKKPVESKKRAKGAK